VGEERTTQTKSSVCVKCGKCQSVCPVFAVQPVEASAARGKMALAEAVLQGHLEPSDTYRDYLEKCLLCGACEELCPNEVKTLSAMLDAREKLAASGGSKLGKKLILKHVVGWPRLLDFVMRVGRTFMSLAFRRLPAESGIRRRFPLPLITRDRTLPDLAENFFTHRYKGQVVSGSGPKVGIFAGCMTNYFYPGTGEGMIGLLEELGASVYVPAGQVCCGMPALTGGARETVRELACRNLEAFEEYDLDFIVTGCASCGGNLKENYGDLLSESGIEPERRQRFLKGILDINEFLYRYGKTGGDEDTADKDSGSGPEITVTYHHPCHLGRVQDVKTEPIALIRSVPGIRYVPMKEEDRCCGMGGSFSLENYDISMEVNDRKIARIIETGADAVVTSCPACIMHIRDGLSRNQKGDIEVLHITELLQRYGCEEQNAARRTQNVECRITNHGPQNPEPRTKNPECRSQ
jgi:glycolate oxidase iron-sulfur subunit